MTWSRGRGLTHLILLPFQASAKHIEHGRKMLLIWKQLTDWRPEKQGPKLLATLTREMQGRMHEMIPLHVLTSADGSNALLERLDAQAGSRAIDEERRAMRPAMYDVSRKGAESLMQYADRRETQFASAAALGHQLPDTYMAQMMIERANLTAQNEQNLRTMTGLRPSMAALKVLDTQSGEQLTKSSGTNRSFVETVELHGEPPPPERFPGEPEDTDDEEIVQTLLAELEPGVAGPFRG